MIEWWRRANIWKKSFILWLGLPFIAAAAAKAGLFDGLQPQEPQPPFNTWKCRHALIDRDYPGMALDELSDDIQFRVRLACDKLKKAYRGY